MARRIILHAGQHKTGSTSIQAYLGMNEATLNAKGIAVCSDATPDLTGMRNRALPTNAKFIANAVIRSSLATPVRMNGSCRALTPEDAATGLRAVNRRLRAMPGETAVLSAEALAFLREPEEMDRLEILCEELDWRAVMFLREPESWLTSWKNHVANSRLQYEPGITPETGIFDFSPNSWLVNHAAIRAFWGSRCSFLDYEQAIGSHGSVIPALLEEIGLDPFVCPPWHEFFRNISAAKPKRQG